MVNSSSSRHISMRSEASFTDAKHWAALAEKHINRFHLPDWDEACAPYSMERWCDRLNIGPQEFMVYTNTDCEDWMALNPDWPLRAFIGILLEFVDTRST